MNANEGPVRHYGVKEQSRGVTAADRAVEDLRLYGFAIVKGGYSATELAEIDRAFDAAHAEWLARHGGAQALAELGEENVIRAPLSLDDAFLGLARNPEVMEICKRLLGDYFILNQQNGLINPPLGGEYSQAAFHRDLPYQHFVASRPLALNALFCLDEFTAENGATLVLPATHRQEEFPTDAAVRAHTRSILAQRGDFIVLDAMLYHSGGVNRTPVPRRAVNNVYSIPIIRQQIDLPMLLGARYAEDPILSGFLGYGVTTPRSVEEYLATRRRRSGARR